MLKYLPNLITLVRLVAAPPLLIAAMLAGSRPWFLGVYIAALLTDSLDGILARRLHAESDIGRRLDSWADYLLILLLLAGLGTLWRDVMAREWIWFVFGIAACFAIVIYGLIRWRKVPGYHTWVSKVLSVALPVSLIPLLAGWTALPFHLVIIAQIAGAIEELAIALILPGYSGEIRSFRHALAARQGQARAPETAASALDRNKANVAS